MHPYADLNSRILIIDDEESVCESFLQALGAAPEQDSQVAMAADALFGEDSKPPSRLASPYAGLTFQVDTANNGREGYQKVVKALAEERPYAVVFTDMRMPGWNGLKTVEHIRQIDERCEIIFVTAYSDYSIDALKQVAGPNVGYFLKPFAFDEVKQIATKAVVDWNKAREMERLLARVSTLDIEPDDIDELLRYLLGEICQWLGADSGALAQLGEDGSLRFRIGRGRLASSEDIGRVSGKLSELQLDKPTVRDDHIILPIKRFGFAIAVPDTTLLTPERIYLLRVFLQHASLAIRSSEARAELIKAKRLSTLGEALSYVVHDIRGPLGNAQVLLHLLREGDESVYTSGELHDLIQQSLVQVEAVVHDTLDYIRGGIRAKKEVVDLAAALTRPLAMVEMELSKWKVPLQISIPAGVRAYIDPLPLLRALRNLAVNAGEAARAVHAPRVEIGAKPDGDGVCIWVADNGPGIAEHVRKHLFEPFRTAGKSQGTGLGLAVVRLIVEAHGGSIEVQSSQSGTCFFLRLP